MALLDTIDIKIRNIIIDQKGHFNDKNVIHQEDITIINVYIPNNRVL